MYQEIYMSIEKPKIENETLLLKIIEWAQKHDKDYSKLTRHDIEDAMKSKGTL